MLKHSTHVCLFSGKESAFTTGRFFFFLNHPVYETEVIYALVWKEEVKNVMIFV